MGDAIVHDVTPWVVISSNSPTNLVQEIKANIAAEEDPPMPFFNSTVEEVYEFFKNHLRPADDDPRGHLHTFSYFTFLVVDADCTNSEPWQCVSAPACYTTRNDYLPRASTQMPVDLPTSANESLTGCRSSAATRLITAIPTRRLD